MDLVENRKYTLLVKLALLITLALSWGSHASADLAQSGTWVNKKYTIDGGWSIETVNGQTVISFDESFKTKKGPDLKLFLSTLDVSSVNGKNAVKHSIKISELESNKGKQQYVLPADIKLDDYASLLIHCEAYSVLWGAAAIN